MKSHGPLLITAGLSYHHCSTTKGNQEHGQASSPLLDLWRRLVCIGGP